MNFIKSIFFKAIKFFKNLPKKKHHLDFLIATLSVPVLALAVYTSVINIQKSKTPLPTPTVTVEKPIIIEKITGSDSNIQNSSSSPTPVPGCIKKVGPISVTNPSEGDVVKDNPVCINISYDDPEYCSVVWSYRINGGSWSSYTGNSPCIYNPPKGQIKFELRVQSTAAQTQTTSLTRNFSYEGTSTTSADLQ